MDFKLVVVLLVAVFSHVEVEANPAAMATSVLEGADTLTNVMQKLDGMFIKPIVKQIEDEVKKIDTNIKGVTEEEKKMVVDALTKLAIGKNDIRRVRAVLSILADETISRSGTMKMILQKTLTANGPKVQLGLRMMVTKMKQLMERSKELLDQSIAEYKKVVDACAVAKVQMNNFVARIDRLSSQWSREHKAAVEKVRAEAYGGAAAGAIGGPIGLAISYSVAAGVVESKIKHWKKKLAELQRQAQLSKQNVIKTVNEVSSISNGLVKEEDLVRRWAAHARVLYDDIKNSDEFVEFLGFDDSMVHDSVGKIDKLVNACKLFKQHVAKNQF